MHIRKYHINLYIIVPLIFSSLSFLTLVITYQLIMYSIYNFKDTYKYLSMLATVSVIFTYITGLLISRIILKPVEEFVEHAEQHPAVKAAAEGESRARTDQLKRFSAVFDQITDLLSQVDAREHFPEIIGQSKAIRSVLAQIMKVAPTDAAVLVTGESGTGKELVARSVVRHSKRHDKPFVAVNCAAIPQGLLESELFGHEKGAFTGATSMKKGKFEQAHTGTLFLDEIGDMPLETQAKILRALETGVCERVGGVKSIKFNVRIITATNKNFEEMLENGEFREDLYHRLNVFPIVLPPLRERRDDIPLLAAHLLDGFKKGLRVTPEALHLLMVSPWPGNVRELKNIMERAAVLAVEGVVTPKQLTGLVMEGVPHEVDIADLPEDINLDEHLQETEKSLILAALAKAGGVQAKAAELLGIKPRSLWHRIKKYEIDVSSLKS